MTNCANQRTWLPLYCKRMYTRTITNLLQYQRRFQISFIDRDGFFSLILLPYVRFVFKFAFFSVILKLYDQYFIQLESDMLVLRSFFNELRNVSDNLREDSTVDSVTTDSGK